MSVHLVLGDDPILRAEALAGLIDELVGEDDRSLALEDLTVPARAASSGERDADDPGGGDERARVVAAALNAAQSPPFMTVRRVVVVREIGNLAAGDADPLVAYLEDPLETTDLVMVTGGGRLPPKLAAALRAADAAEVGPESEATDKVLARYLRAAGAKLQPEAAKAVARHLGDDAGRVPQLVDVLVAAYGPGATLDTADVEPYLGEEGSVPGWQLANAIEAGDVAGALATLRRMLTATGPRQAKPMHPLQVLAMLHGQYRRLLRLDDPEVRGPDDAVAALGGRVKAYPARKALAQARALRADGIRQAYDWIAQADLDLKGARAIPEETVMEVLIARLANLSARARSGAGRPA